MFRSAAKSDHVNPFKSKMNSPYKRPESILIVIHTPDGEVLLLRRVSPADFWQSVTGSLEWGESAEAAARRELAEETGFDASGLQATDLEFTFPIVPPWRERYAPDATTNHETVFSLLLPAPRAPRLDPAEHSEYRWLPKEEAIALASSWTNRDAIRRLVAE